MNIINEIKKIDSEESSVKLYVFDFGLSVRVVDMLYFTLFFKKSHRSLSSGAIILLLCKDRGFKQKILGWRKGLRRTITAAAQN